MLTELGFKRMRYDDFLPIIEQQARELFGADVDLDPNSPLGQFVRLQAYSRAEENELAEDVWNSFQVEKATGVSLDAAVKTVLDKRLQASKARKYVDLLLNGNITVRKGAIVGTKDNIKFVTLEDVYANKRGYYRVDIEAQEYGVIGNVPANTITEIFTPVSGWESVNNPEATTGGRERETDDELRDRYFNGGLSKRGKQTLASIKAALLDEVPGVLTAYVNENDSNEWTDDGIPPHSIYCIVQGGEPQAIADKIFERKGGGIRAFGDVEREVIDEMGESHKVGFFYAKETWLFANVSIKTDNTFPVNGDDLIKLEIVKYIGGHDNENNVHKGIGMGQTVICARVANAVFNVDGVVDVSVTLSTDNVDFQERNITTTKSEVAQISFENVVIEHV